MMMAASETPLARAQAYRAAWRAFIAACEAAHVDTIARLHPAKPVDGKPLFMDSAALGPRLAECAVLAVACDGVGSAIQTELLKAKIQLPDRARLVLVHACDPALFAGVESDPDWPAAMLGAVATEDLSRVVTLAILPLAMGEDGLAEILGAHLPKAAILCLPRADDPAAAQAAIRDFLAQ
jgi:Protein of unknown function (DUF2817)